jgi:hypothetical protein
MKKKTVRKLTLHRETIRELTSAHARRVHGGASDVGGCWTEYPECYDSAQCDTAKGLTCHDTCGCGPLTFITACM